RRRSGDPPVRRPAGVPEPPPAGRGAPLRRGGLVGTAAAAGGTGRHGRHRAGHREDPGGNDGMSNGETIGYGVIGCGGISSWDLRALTQHVKGARVVAVADEIPERAEKRAQEFGVPKTYIDYEQLLEDPEIQAVSICTPSGMHGDMVIAAS